VCRHLLEEIQLEQRAVAREEAHAGNQVMEQIEHLQKHLDEAKIAAARDTVAGSQLDKEVSTCFNFEYIGVNIGTI
jgi:hypothetical protein